MIRYQYDPLRPGLLHIRFETKWMFDRGAFELMFPGREAQTNPEETEWYGLYCSVGEWDHYIAWAIDELVKRGEEKRTQTLGYELVRFRNWVDQMKQTARLFYKDVAQA